MLPIQLKPNHKTYGIDTKIGLGYLKDNSISENECILLAEGNHVTGKTANIATNMIKEMFLYILGKIYLKGWMNQLILS